jgi:hypothetical protein
VSGSSPNSSWRFLAFPEAGRTVIPALRTYIGLSSAVAKGDRAPNDPRA